MYNKLDDLMLQELVMGSCTAILRYELVYNELDELIVHDLVNNELGEPACQGRYIAVECHVNCSIHNEEPGPSDKSDIMT